MFSKLKVPRFNDIGEKTPPTPRRTSPSPASFKRSTSSLRSCQDSQPKAKSAREDEPPSSAGSRKKSPKKPPQAAPRSNSLDRSHDSSTSRKGDRLLKKTSSMIPRATAQKMKENSPTEELKKPQSRKSDTSLKKKHEDPNKTKKLERKKSSRTAIILNSKSYHSSTSGETSDFRKPVSPKVTSATTKHRKTSAPLALTRPKTPPVRLPASNTETVLPKKGLTNVKPVLGVPQIEKLNKNLESQYVQKKRIFQTMKHELEEKQKLVMDQYKCLNIMREKIMATTGRDFPQEEELKVVDIGCFSQESLLHAKPAGITSGLQEKLNTFNNKLASDAEVDFTEFHNTFEVRVIQVSEIWMSTAVSLSALRDETMAWIAQRDSSLDITTLEAETESIKLAFENAKSQTKEKSEELIGEIKKLFTNREMIRSELRVVNDGMTSMLANEYKELMEKFKEINEQLEKERTRANEAIDRKALLEETNHSLKEKMKDLERSMMTNEAKVSEMSSQLKTLKQKDSFAQRANTSQKNKEYKDLKAKSELLKGLEVRITELTNEQIRDRKNYEKRIAELITGLEEEKAKLEAEEENSQNLKNSLKETEEKLDKIRAKRKDLSELVEKSKMNLQPQGAGKTSKREEELWMELEATKVVVKGLQEQIGRLQEEKNKILHKFQKLSEDNTNQQSERLAAEIVRKDDIVQALKAQVADLQRTCEEYNAKYNKLQTQLREFQEKVQEGKLDPVSLSKEIGDLKALNNDLQQTLNDLMAHNQQLEDDLAQRNMEIEQRDRLVQHQCGLNGIRDELITLLRSKDENQNHEVKKMNEEDAARWEKRTEKIYKDLEKKSQSLDDMYTILTEKQTQVDRLDKLVKKMEEQQDRAQEQRVRLESKIAELQKQLQERKTKSAKKSLFSE